MSPFVALLLSYVIGSIPSAYIAGKLKGIDLRKHGSGNLGATNVYRVLGARVAAVVFLADVLKGALPVLLFPRWTAAAGPMAAHWAYAYGLAAILGHVRPVFLLWKGGGKGVATATGVFFALAPLAMALAFVTFVGVVYATGYVSLGSLTGALVLSLALLFTQGVRSPLFALAALVTIFVFWSHRANIRRLRRGEEHRFGRKSASGGDASRPAGVPAPTTADMGAPPQREVASAAGASRHPNVAAGTPVPPVEEGR
ncbi:MAG TPA: glycerol-3-phosphate 1-O-acyltransferase PlsY [Gaiellaceae bacterium]|nr:glycerol-3-phosphate 1-O-acyltransferase PlsY [Gaiellaceae bacterium]